MATGKTDFIGNMVGLAQRVYYAKTYSMDAIRSVSVFNPSPTTSVNVYIGSSPDSKPITIPPNFSQTMPIQPSAAVTLTFPNAANDGTVIFVHIDTVQLTANGFQGAINIGNVNVVNTPNVVVSNEPTVLLGVPVTPVEIFDTTITLVGGPVINIYTVPADKTLYITDVSLTGEETCVATSASLMGAQLRRASNNSVIVDTINVVQFSINTTQGYHYFHSYRTAPTVVAGDTLEWLPFYNGAATAETSSVIVHGFLL